MVYFLIYSVEDYLGGMCETRTTYIKQLKVSFEYIELSVKVQLVPALHSPRNMGLTSVRRL